ncbi:Sec-independent protein translocase protein TatB [Sphingobium sp. HBC34]|uniref:Sec-independent protein translocase protein TatB n=1 Tax=Sphingobium cyanobacteriorum TaxID=3063954 RepID=A0ABT8ZMX6_9SPHN|nr:Sec-independent protein translocase protein TatB [Sphingobium sp. HBC34]MDO7834866.1 Sec-independent protein translocase protein TatB [Sphingobium sp. HBC34]
MFGIDSSELLVIVIIAVIVIGPKDLPRALYKVGQIVGKAQGMARHFRTGIDAMVREVELEELEKKWAAQNKRIMDEHPPETLPAPAAEDKPAFVAQSAPVDDRPPYVAEAAPALPPAPASEGPPYVAEAPTPAHGSASHKGDATA